MNAGPRRRSVTTEEQCERGLSHQFKEFILFLTVKHCIVVLLVHPKHAG